MSHIWCPACGWFGLRARRRNARAADTGLILFHAQLAAEARRRRVKRIVWQQMANDIGLAPWMRTAAEKRLTEWGVL